MIKMILPKNKLNAWLVALNKYDLFAPMKDGDVVLYHRLDNANEIVLDAKSAMSPKGMMLPQTETLFKYNVGKNTEINEPTAESGKRIIFAIRPCDARGLSVLDRMFKDGIKDPYYLNARERTTLIGLSCNEPWYNCFCTSLDGSPGAREDVDVLLTDLGDRYYVDIVTEKGQGLVDESESLFASSSDGDRSEKDAIVKKAEESFQRSVELEGVPETLGTIFDADYWKKIAARCLGCGTCTYVCPTCHCFDIQDEKGLLKGRRARMWDSCMYPEYTIHTSGHNPRPARMNRIRNRVYHKFKYFCDNFDVNLCIGCGRCVEKCPVNIDIIEIVSDLKEGV